MLAEGGVPKPASFHPQKSRKVKRMDKTQKSGNAQTDNF